MGACAAGDNVECEDTGVGEMTVEQAVLSVLIEHYPSVKNALIQTAHPAHQLSGLTRLRGLKKKGIVNYTFDAETNEYYILTPLENLVRALEEMKKGNRNIGKTEATGETKKRVATVPASKTLPRPSGREVIRSGATGSAPAISSRWEIDPSEIRKFAESLK